MAKSLAPRTLLHIALACALIIPLSACKDKTFEAPTQVTPLAPIDSLGSTDSTESQQLAASLTLFAADTAHQVQNQLRPDDSLNNPAFVYSPLAIYTNNLALLNGANGQTYKDLSTFLQISEPDHSPLNLATNELLLRLKDNDINIRNSIWMIWPFKIQPAFQSRMARTLNVDIQRTGTFGIAAQDALTIWTKEASHENFEILNSPLDKNTYTCLISIATFSYQAPPEATILATKETNDYIYQVLELSPSLLLKIYTPKDAKQPFPKIWPKPQLQEAATATAPIPTIKYKTKFNVSPLLTTANATSLTQGPLDLAPISLELSGNYQLTQFQAATALDIQGQPNPNRFHFIIAEKATNTPLFAGTIDPN